VTEVNRVYGANWLQPVQILDPRLVQISGMLTF
jgi:hypothetical protein